jgi:hypothetical protein
MNLEAREPIRFGRILQQAMLVLRANFIQFYLVGLAVGIPTLVLSYVMPPDSPFTTSGIVESILAQVATAAITYGSFKYLRRQSTNAWNCLQYAGQKFGRIVGLAIVSGLLIFIGMLLLIVPGLVLATMFAVAMPVLLIEDLSISDCLKRSAALTLGYRWQVFGLVVLTTGVLLGGTFLLGAILVLADMVDDGFGALDIVLWLWTGLYYAVAAVIAATLYYRLREVKEGLGLDQLAAVFD